MCACSDVDFGLVIAAGRNCGVVEEAESAVTFYVTRREPVGPAFFGVNLWTSVTDGTLTDVFKTYLEPDSEKSVDLLHHFVAVLLELVELYFFLSETWRKWLAGFAILEFSEVVRSGGNE